MEEIMNSPQFRHLFFIAIAMFLGGLIGFDRELEDKPAGLRTHMLVAGAAALLTSLADALVSNPELSDSVIRTDPIRLTEAIVTGVSFLGAGTIFRNKDKESTVEGLTTAASILFVAAIGISVALSQFITAVGGTILILVTLRVLKFVSEREFSRISPE